jgi:hypothetical protein
MSFRKKWTAEVTYNGATERLSGHVTQDNDYEPWDAEDGANSVRRLYGRNGSDANNIVFED